MTRRVEKKKYKTIKIRGMILPDINIREIWPVDDYFLGERRESLDFEHTCRVWHLSALNEQNGTEVENVYL